MNDDTDARLDKLTAELETLNSHRFIRVHNSLWRLILFQFTRGLAFGPPYSCRSSFGGSLSSSSFRS
jgi:hypothetical protein